MIGRLTGTLQVKTPSLLLMDVNGVGYEIFVPMSTYYQLPELGECITLLTHFHIREDLQVLYGFYEENERALFRALIKISGVGPKMALTILSGMDVDTFLNCVEYRDLDILVRLPGVGKKTAERLVVEMAGKLKIFEKGHSGMSDTASDEAILKRRISNGSVVSPVEEATEALVNLGYKPQEAMRAIARVIEDENAKGEENANKHLPTQDIIRRALQSFAKV